MDVMSILSSYTLLPTYFLSLFSPHFKNTRWMRNTTCVIAVDGRGHPAREWHVSILACRRRAGRWRLVMPGKARVQSFSRAGPFVRALAWVVGAGWGPGCVATGQVFLQVVQPHGQRSAVVQCSGRVDESVGQQLSAFFHKQATLNSVTQHLLQQLHILAFGLAVAWLQQRQVWQQQGHHFLLWLLMPLADDC